MNPELCEACSHSSPPGVGPEAGCVFLSAAATAGEHVHQPRPGEAAGHHLRVRRGQADARLHRQRLSAAGGARSRRALQCS